jgi:hypothetical protein
MPQFAASVCTFTHTPLQRVCPAGQAHSPITQAVPPAQRTPQAPQWVASVWVFTHAPPQAVWPIAHDEPQAPALQT